MTRWIKVLASVAVLVAIVAAVSGGAGAAGTPSAAAVGGGRAAPASTRAVKSASTRAVNSRPTVANRNVASTLMKLHETLDENDDVQAVFSNEEIDDTVAAEPG